VRNSISTSVWRAD